MEKRCKYIYPQSNLLIILDLLLTLVFKVVISATPVGFCDGLFCHNLKFYGHNFKLTKIFYHKADIITSNKLLEFLISEFEILMDQSF